MIDGVELKEIITHTDERGFFREIFKEDDSFFVEGIKQVSWSMKYKNYYTHEFHFHKQQIDWWVCPIGLIKVVLFDLRNKARDKMELFLGENIPYVLKIPYEVAHGFKVIEGPSALLYATSQVYNPEDEGRISIEYDWSK